MIGAFNILLVAELKSPSVPCCLIVFRAVLLIFMHGNMSFKSDTIQLTDVGKKTFKEH